MQVLVILTYIETNEDPYNYQYNNVRASSPVRTIATRGNNDYGSPRLNKMPSHVTIGTQNASLRKPKPEVITSILA